MNKFVELQRQGSKESWRGEESQPGHDFGRANMRAWMEACRENAYLTDPDFQHTLRYHLGAHYDTVHGDLAAFGDDVSGPLTDATSENDRHPNNPRVERYNGIGERIEKIVHHPSYADAGNMIYRTGVVGRLARKGGLREGMGFYFLACQAGEAGHNCPVICNFEIARLLRDLPNVPERDYLVEKLETLSYDDNFTASQFLTEVQGGSDVGANATLAWQDDAGDWHIRGEKWFCSNADAELIVLSARYDETQAGTKGLAMFAVPVRKPDGTLNDYSFRRLKEKLGTRALASSEIDFHDAYAIPLGPVEKGFNRMMENVIHHSRIALATAVLGFTQRGYRLARVYADTRHAFGKRIIDYPLVRENLARIKAELTVGLAGTYALIALQDANDTGESTDPARQSFGRLMANVGKSVISKRAVDSLHRAVDTLAGNGAIETTSVLPRLLRETVIFENWEGSHNTLLMQVLRDIHRYDHDKAYFQVMNEELATLGDNLSEERAFIAAELDVLKEKAAELRTASPELQTMKIQHVIDRMGDLYYYLAAVREGDDLAQATGDDAKLAAAAFYRRWRLSDAPIEWDDTMLGLIARVVRAA